MNLDDKGDELPLVYSRLIEPVRIDAGGSMVKEDRLYYHRRRFDGSAIECCV